GSSHDGSTPSAFSSNQATLLDFEFDGRLVTYAGNDPKDAVSDQMLFLLGHLNPDNNVARLDKLLVSGGTTEPAGAETVTVQYHVKIPVAWGSKTNLPSSYDLTIPLDMRQAAQQRLYDAVKDKCIEGGAHDPDLGSFWYYYRPNQSGCVLADADVVKTRA